MMMMISVVVYGWNDPIQRRQSIWKSGGVQLPLSSSPLPSLSLPFPLPSLLPVPRAATHPKAARGSGERCKLPQWGLEQSPSRQTIWCISGPKGVALFYVSFFVNTTGPSCHSRIVRRNDWIELAISSRLLSICPKGCGCGPCLDPPLWC